MASLYTLSSDTPSLDSTSRKVTPLQNLSASSHTFRQVREVSSDWVT